MHGIKEDGQELTDLDKTDATYPQTFGDDGTWNNDSETNPPHMSFSELHEYRSKKIKYYYDVDIKKWGLHGTYSMGEQSVYKFTDTD